MLVICAGLAVAVTGLGALAHAAARRSVLSRVRGSLQRDGVQRTGRRLLSKIADYSFDVRYGTDTGRWVECHDLDLAGPNAPHAVNYAPTRAREFRELLRTMAVPSDGVFVDFGSGKGRVLLLASDYGFRKVVGVELSPALCETARANVLAYRRRKPAGAPISIVEADAAAYEFCDDETVIFLFNPFGPLVVSAVLDSTRASIARQPRQLWLIYNNPSCHDLLDHAGYLRKLRDFEFSSSIFAVYTNDSVPALAKVQA